MSTQNKKLQKDWGLYQDQKFEAKAAIRIRRENHHNLEVFLGGPGILGAQTSLGSSWSWVYGITEGVGVPFLFMVVADDVYATEGFFSW